MNRPVPLPSHSPPDPSPIAPRWFWWLAFLLVAANIACWLPTRYLPPILHDRAIGTVFLAISFLVLALCWTMWFALSYRSVGGWRWIPLLVLLIGLAGLAASVRVDQVWGVLIPYRVSWRWQPTRDHRLPPLEIVEGESPVDLATTTPDDYPRFLGSAMDLTVNHVELETDWSARPPERLWEQPIGAGWSGFAAVNGYAVTMEQRGDRELVTCYEIPTGKLRWATAEKQRFDSAMGGQGPRATPTIADGRVYACGATGILRCLDGATGKVLWRYDVLGENGTSPATDEQVIAWGRAHSPLVVGDRVIIPFGGPPGGPYVTLGALDAQTGNMIWKDGSHLPAYASPTLANLHGVDQILLTVQDYVVSHDLQNGELLWQFPWQGSSNANANVSQPVALDDQRVFISKGYGAGSAVYQIEAPDGGRWEPRLVWRNRRALKTKFTNVVIHQGHAYGLDEGVLSCVDLSDGRIRWKRGRYGHGQVLRVSNVLLVLGEGGEVALVELSPETYQELSRFRALDGKTWNNPCLFGDMLLVRNSEQAACYRLPLR
jgi:outer membrane protein assembly factor BamB